MTTTYLELAESAGDRDLSSRVEAGDRGDNAIPMQPREWQSRVGRSRMLIHKGADGMDRSYDKRQARLVHGFDSRGVHHQVQHGRLA